MEDDVKAAEEALYRVEAALGCNAFAIDGHGKMALHYAAASFSFNVVKFFIQCRADTEAVDSNNRRAIDELNRYTNNKKWADQKDRADATALLLKEASDGRHASSSNAVAQPSRSSSSRSDVPTLRETSAIQPKRSSSLDKATEGTTSPVAHIVVPERTQASAEPAVDPTSPKGDHSDEHTSRRLTGIQHSILEDQAKEAWQLDPAKNPQAEADWAERIQEVPVSELFHTHKNVGECFLNGSHNGRPIAELLEGLENGSVDPSALPCLVAAKHQGELRVVFGNRRLWALKRFAENTDCDVRARVIIHEMPNPGIASATLQSAFVAKFTLSYTTEDGGMCAPVRKGALLKQRFVKPIPKIKDVHFVKPRPKAHFVKPRPKTHFVKPSPKVNGAGPWKGPIPPSKQLQKIPGTRPRTVPTKARTPFPKFRPGGQVVPFKQAMPARAISHSRSCTPMRPAMPSMIQFGAPLACSPGATMLPPGIYIHPRYF